MGCDQDSMSGEAEQPSPLEAVEDGVPPVLQVGGELPHMVRALRHRDFRLFWGGNFLSNIGTWMQNVAMGWLVLQLAPSHAAFWLGIVGFASSLPMLAFSLLGGVIADRIDRRKLMLITQSAMMIFAFILWGLTALHWMSLPLLVLLSFATGVAMALNAPSYQALVPQLVPREDLANAIALNAAQFNLSRVFGPTLGGFAMAWFGVQGNFLLNALSFVAVLVALAFIHYPPLPSAGESTMWEDLTEGLRYVYERKELLTLLAMTAVASVLVVPYVNFVPLFAKQILHLDASGFGLLMAANGGGAFLAAVTMALPHHGKHRGRIVFRSALAFYGFVALFALSHNRWLSALMLVATGYFMILMIATVNVMLQHLSEDKMRGRVMSIYAMAFLGFSPLGSLMAGSLAGTFTAPLTLAAMAALAMALNIAIYRMRPALGQLE
ncbi:MAG: MFS transporter [Candidatus Korobacteraceae bacterium]